MAIVGGKVVPTVVDPVTVLAQVVEGLTILTKLYVVEVNTRSLVTVAVPDPFKVTV